jgi:hypothetical protein
MRLGDAANFCLTVLEEYSGASKGKRRAASGRYYVAKRVLDTLGTLADEKGRDQARKARGANTPFTAAEREWLEKTMSCLILRAAEGAGRKSSAPLPQITMASLPPLP